MDKSETVKRRKGNDTWGGNCIWNNGIWNFASARILWDLQRNSGIAQAPQRTESLHEENTSRAGLAR